MLLVIFAGSLLPYLQCLDSWLYDGILDDPYEEVLKKQSFIACFYIFHRHSCNCVKHYKTSMSGLIDILPKSKHKL